MAHLAAVVVAILAWWLSTGAVLFAAGREHPRRVPLIVVATALAIGGLWAIHAGARMEGVTGAYLGFGGALAVWAWHETSFLAGVVTGPRRGPCPAGATGFERFSAAFGVIRDHELAILATGIVVLAIAWDAPDRTGLHTFLLLWAMRVSSKLVLFLGAPHAGLAMLPRRLGYLASYFRTDRTTAAFPLFLGAALLVFAGLCMQAASATRLHDGVSATLLATFAGLAVLEHLLLVAPVSDAALWRWAMPTGARATRENAGGPGAADTNDNNGSQGSSGECGRHPAAA